MTLRVGVYNIDGIKINTILVEEDVLADPNYWPGYGIALISEGVELVEPPKFTPTGRPKEWLGEVKIALSEIPQTGDTVDFKSGQVIKKQPDPIPDPVIDPIAQVDSIIVGP